MRYVVVVFVLVAASVFAQEPAEPGKLIVEPDELTLEVGETATLTATVEDANGNAVDRAVVFYSRRRRSVSVNPAGQVEAYRPGEHVLVAMVPKNPEDLDRRADALLTVEIAVTIPNPPAASVSFVDMPTAFYEGTVVPVNTDVVDTSGANRSDIPVRLETSNQDVASLDEIGSLSLGRAGRVRITAHAESIEATIDIEVSRNPVVSFELAASDDNVRTGDVVFFEAKALDAGGNPVPDFPVRFATSARPAADIIAAGAIGQIDDEGAFVAERPGLHTIVAIAGSHTAVKTIEVRPRNVRMGVEVVGQGPVRDRHTSDLWVWEAPDGRDYAITGTWGADGHAYFWDVTNPASIHLVDTRARRRPYRQ